MSEFGPPNFSFVCIICCMVVFWLGWIKVSSPKSRVSYYRCTCSNVANSVWQCREEINKCPLWIIRTYTIDEFEEDDFIFLLCSCLRSHVMAWLLWAHTVNHEPWYQIAVDFHVQYELELNSKISDIMNLMSVMPKV